MGSFYTPNLPYNLNTFLENLGAYSLTEESFAQLDQMIELVESRKYYFQGVPFPVQGDCNLDGYATISGNITVPPLSYVVAISGDSFYTTTVEIEGGGGHLKMARNLQGFKFKMYDKGAKLDIVVDSLFTEWFATLGYMARMTNPGVLTNRPIGPNLLQSPMIVLAPGSLQMEITNLSQYPVFVQMFMMMCVPVNRQSTNENITVTGNNDNKRN